MIPKIIHYCWFGETDKPDPVKKNIDTWKLYYPDYIVKEWNESNFDVNNMPFVKEAYEKKKYAFVSDVARIYALVNEGGIYFDTDVLIVKRIPDDFLFKSSFIGFEDYSKIGTAIIASENNHHFWIEFYNYYKQLHFILEDNSLNMTPNVDILTNILKGRGLKCNNSLQIIEDICIFPQDYFSPKSYLTGKIVKTNNTFTIHDFAGSWLPWFITVENKFWNRLGLFNPHILLRLYNLFKYGTLRQYVK